MSDRWRRAVAVGVMLGLTGAGAGHGQAQQRTNDPRGGDAAMQRMTPEQRDEAAREAADRLEATGGDSEALLGAPAPYRDPYRSAFNSTENREDALVNTQRVPRGALAGGQYGPQPAAKGQKQGQVPLPGVADKGDAGGPNPNANKADPGTRTPMGSARSIYHGPGDVGKAVQQVYKTPW